MPDTAVLELPRPTRCYCQVPLENLRFWLARRVRGSKTTMDLLAEAETPEEREEIGIVALLDVDDATFVDVMSSVGLPTEHMLACRAELREILSELEPGE